MSLLTKWLLIVLALGLLAASASGQTNILCTETSSGPTAGDSANGLQQGGCVAALIGPIPTIVVASDGNVSFQPFGLTYDISDGIQLNANWGPDPAYAASFATGFWTQVAGTSTWVLPASTPCGIENEPACEPAAKWDFLPGSQWGGDEGSPQYMLEFGAAGGVSDTITLDNSGPNGSAAITFQSDPVVPEPGTLTLLGLGVGFAIVAKRLRKKAV